MIAPWILIIITTVSAGPYTSGPAVSMQEFGTQGRCEQAADVVTKVTMKDKKKLLGGSSEEVQTLYAFCVQK